MNIRLDIVDVMEGVKGKMLARHGVEAFDGISIDSRTIKPGQLFLALKGENYDGHDYIKDALEKGAGGVMVDDAFLKANSALVIALAREEVVIMVKDTLKALGNLAAFIRNKLPHIPLVAITGSNGKTTCKEMLYSILVHHAGEDAVLKNQGNFNNLIGMPLTLLQMEEKHKFAVVEMGMNRRGEIARLAEIASPHVGVITNVHPVHLEFLKDIEEVFKAKAELFAMMIQKKVKDNYPAKGDITAVINADDPLAMRAIKLPNISTITFGKNRGSDVRLTHWDYNDVLNLVFEVQINKEKFQFQLPHLGKHNVFNALAAICAARILGIPAKDIAAGLQKAQVAPSRLNVVRSGKIVIIDDTYNSNPRSLDMAIKTLHDLTSKEGKRRVVVLGDMLELGEASLESHQQVGAALAVAELDVIALYGPNMEDCHQILTKYGCEDPLFHSQDMEEVLGWLDKQVKPGDAILVKGSRGMATERVVEHLNQSFG